jgi:hypothetical protein
MNGVLLNRAELSANRASFSAGCKVGEIAGGGPGGVSAAPACHRAAEGTPPLATCAFAFVNPVFCLPPAPHHYLI